MSNNQYTSTPTPPTTPTQTDQVSGDIDQARDTGSNNTSGDQPHSIRIDEFLPDMPVEEYQRWAEVINASNNEPAVCMSELWTLSPDAINPFYTESETPVAAAMENLTIRHSSDTVRRPGTPIPTGGVENGNAPQSDWDNQRSISVNDLLPETQTGDILAMYAPFRQYLEDEASSAAPSENTFHIISSETNHANLQTDNSGRSGNSENSGVFGVTPFDNIAPATHRVTNGNTPIRDLRAGGNASMGNLPSVYTSGLQSDTSALDLFTLLNEDGAPPSETTSANIQTNPANLVRRNRRAQRPVVPLSQMTSEQMQAFWQEFSDPEDDGEINDGTPDEHLVIHTDSVLEPMTASFRRAMGLDGHDSENDRGST
ncbi:hypothetical protein EJ07DRAFT_171096 [Lizonia empirigonia]|nr:hypothetical protein EJ07DRAFT_171096 [Lizonia empirigonia]